MIKWIQKSRSRILAAYLIIAVFMITTVIGLSRSVYSPAPATGADVVVFIGKGDHGLLLTEIRKFVGAYVETMGVSRYLYDESNPSSFFVIEGGNFDTLVGEFPVMHTYVLPVWVKGRWCSGMTVTWWPSWSQRQFSIKQQDACFETSEYE